MSSPVLFNAIKHHLNSILDLIAQRVSSYDESLLKKELLKLGGSQMDLYTGDLNLDEIKCEIVELLKEQGHFERTSYQTKLDAHDGFYSVHLSDGSLWVLRWGNEEGHYIHIHPGRYSLHSFRVKAGMLKTAIAVLICSKNDKLPVDLPLINKTRVRLLDLSPIKSYTPDDGIGELIVYLEEKLNERM